jgi:hypothetical protein
LHHPVLYNPDTESNVKYPTEKNNGLMKNKWCHQNHIHYTSFLKKLDIKSKEYQQFQGLSTAIWAYMTMP